MQSYMKLERELKRLGFGWWAGNYWNDADSFITELDIQLEPIIDPTAWVNI